MELSLTPLLSWRPGPLISLSLTVLARLTPFSTLSNLSISRQPECFGRECLSFEFEHREVRNRLCANKEEQHETASVIYRRGLLSGLHRLRGHGHGDSSSHVLLCKRRSCRGAVFGGRCPRLFHRALPCRGDLCPG